VLTKSIGTQNPINLVKATMDGLIRLRRPEEVAELRGLTISQVLGLQNGTSADGEHLAAGPVADADTAPPDAEGSDAEAGTEAEGSPSEVVIPPQPTPLPPEGSEEQS
jgi:small subunit ribosomal protein S5